MKANLYFIRFSVKGKEKVENELRFVFMAVNLRKYTAMNTNPTIDDENNSNSKGSNHQFLMIGTFLKIFWLVMSQSTDKADAFVITKIFMVDLEKREQIQDKITVELKELTRHRRRLGKHHALFKTQYTRILEKSFPELASYGQVRYSDYMMRLLKKYPSPRRIAKAHEKTLSELLGVNNSSLQSQMLKQLAKESIGCYSEITEFELTQTIQQIYLYDKQIKEVDKKIQEMMDKLDSPIVTIPGISYRLGSIIIAEIGDIHNFNNPGQLLAFAGMEPSIYQANIKELEKW